MEASVRFKLDENLRRAAAVLVDAGFDAVTVSEQRLQGAPHRQLIEWCVQEERCLVTLDAEFGNPLWYPLHRFRGIALLRLPAHVTNENFLETLNTLGDALLTRARPAGSPIPLPGPDGHLCVVQPGRVRLYQSEEPGAGWVLVVEAASVSLEPNCGNRAGRRSID